MGFLLFNQVVCIISQQKEVAAIQDEVFLVFVGNRVFPKIQHFRPAMSV